MFSILPLLSKCSLNTTYNGPILYISFEVGPTITTLLSWSYLCFHIIELIIVNYIQNPRAWNHHKGVAIALPCHIIGRNFIFDKTSLGIDKSLLVYYFLYFFSDDLEKRANSPEIFTRQPLPAEAHSPKTFPQQNVQKCKRNIFDRFISNYGWF